MFALLNHSKWHRDMYQIHFVPFMYTKVRTMYAPQWTPACSECKYKYFPSHQTPKLVVHTSLQQILFKREKSTLCFSLKAGRRYEQKFFNQFWMEEGGMLCCLSTDTCAKLPVILRFYKDLSHFQVLSTAFFKIQFPKGLCVLLGVTGKLHWQLQEMFSH